MTIRTTDTYAALARRSWMGPVPSWVEKLAREADATSLNDLARRLRRSRHTLRKALHGIYDVETDGLARDVRAELAPIRRGRTVDMARAAWGEHGPEWVLRLAEACDRHSQTEIAERLRLSPSTVNAVLRNRYGADTTAIELRVRGRLMDDLLLCPALGVMWVDLCADHQDKAASRVGTSSMRLRMRDACRACPKGRWARTVDQEEGTDAA
jgi:methylphosphotriester-DNA--protein-cysteine methyltransferase